MVCGAASVLQPTQRATFAAHVAHMPIVHWMDARLYVSGVLSIRSPCVLCAAFTTIFDTTTRLRM